MKIMSNDAQPGHSTWFRTATLALVGLLGQTAEAETITVCADGSCHFASVDEAIMASSPGDRIEIGSGSYPLTMSQDFIDRASEIVGTLGKDGPSTELRLETDVDWYVPEVDFQIRSLAFAGAIEDVPTFRFRLHAADAGSISITDCNMEGLRGTFCNVPVPLQIERCTFDSCEGGQSTQGGSAFISSPNLLLSDSIVRRCTFGGYNNYFIASGWDSRLDILDTRFEANTPTYYSLIQLWGSNLQATLRRCVFEDNRPPATASWSNTAGSALVSAVLRSLEVDSCRFNDGRNECSADETISGAVPIQIFSGDQISITNCDFEANAQAIRLVHQGNFDPLGLMHVSNCRFTGNYRGPTCQPTDSATCPIGGAFGGFYGDPFLPDDPDAGFHAERVIFSDCHFCDNGGTPLSGAWTDGGGNCISRDCVDLDGDGTADPCLSDGHPTEIHVPDDAPDLATALAAAVRGQSIVLAPGDHELVGLTNITAADLTIRAEVAIAGPTNTARIVLVDDGNVGLRVLSSPGEGVRFKDLDFVLPAGDGFEPVCVGSSQPVLEEGLIIVESAAVEFRSCRILANGSPIAIAAFHAHTRFDDCQLINTGSNVSSPLIHVVGGDLSVSETLFDAVRIRIDDAVLTASLSTFESVTSLRGAIEAWNSQVTTDRCDLIGCSATGGGSGGIVTESGALRVTNCWFRENGSAAPSGGAIMVRGEGTLELSSSVFCGNAPDDIYSSNAWDDLGGNAFADDGCARMAGDLDGDGCISAVDLGRLLQQWAIKTPTDADLDRDGEVGGGDLGLLFTNWGRCF